MGVDDGNQLFFFRNLSVVAGQIGHMLEEVGHDIAGGGGGILNNVVRNNGQFQFVAQSSQIVLDQFHDFGMGIFGGDHRNGFSSEGGGKGQGQSQSEYQSKDLLHGDISFHY